MPASSAEQQPQSKADWATTSVHAWRGAVYGPESFFHELNQRTVEYIKQAAAEVGMRPADSVLIDVGSGTGDLLFALGDSFDKLIGVDFNEGFLQWSEQAEPEHLRSKTRFLRGNASQLREVISTTCGNWIAAARKVVICTGNTLGIMPDDVRSSVLQQMKQIAGDDGVVIVGYWNARWFGHAVQHFYAKHPELCGALDGAEYDWHNAILRTNQGYRTKWTTAAEAKVVLEGAGFELRDLTETMLGVLCTCAGGQPAQSSAELASKQYYDSEDSFWFYRSVWGGTHIHVGLYDHPEVLLASLPRERVRIASDKSVLHLFDKVPIRLDPSSRVMDMGAAYGGAARYAAKQFGCRVCCIEISERSNEVNRQETERTGLSHLVEIPGSRSFTHTMEPDETFDLIISEDAFLHAGDVRPDIFVEMARLLKPGGCVVFTDIMQVDSVDPKLLAPVYERIKLQDMGSVDRYRRWANDAGLTLVEFEDRTENLATHYGLVRDVLASNDESLARLSPNFRQKMEAGLSMWVEHASAGHLQWGYLVLTKPTTHRNG